MSKNKLAPVRAYKNSMDALAALREQYPEFFNDKDIKEIAAIIIEEMGDELKELSPIQQATMIAFIINMMYRMGTAALKSVHGQDIGMARHFINRYRADKAVND